MFKWILKKMGYHVCENFSKWEEKTEFYTRPWRYDDYCNRPNDGIIRFSKTFQRRYCLDCGKIQREEIA